MGMPLSLLPTPSLFARGTSILCRMGRLLGAWRPPLSLGVPVCGAQRRASRLGLREPRGTCVAEGA
jgi:hypothetical protein